MLDPAPLGRLPDSGERLLAAVLALSSDLDLHGVLTRVVESATELTGAGRGALRVLGPDDGFGEFVTPGPTREDPDPTSWEGVLSVAVHIRGTGFGHLYLADKEGGGDFTDLDRQLVAGLADAAGVVVENARAYGLSERRRRWLEASAELTDSLQPPVEWEGALTRISTASRRLGTACATGVVGPDGGVLALDCAPARVEWAEQLMNRAVATAGDDPVDVAVDGVTATVVPLRVRLIQGGTLVVLYDEQAARLREPDERELLISLADHAALALDRALAVDDRELLAVLSERERIARDLHDTVIQRLFAVGMQLQAAALELDDRPEEIGQGQATRVREAMAAVDETIREIRASIFELQPPP